MRVNFYENRCTLRQLRSDVKGESNGLNNGSIIKTERIEREKKKKFEEIRDIFFFFTKLTNFDAFYTRAG